MWGEDLNDHRNNQPVILLINDDQVLCDLVEVAVDEPMGTIVTARTQKRAREIIRSGHVAMVIVDGAFQGGRGIDLLAGIREQFPRIIRIFVPENGDSEQYERAVNIAEVDHILKKPWKRESVLAALKHGWRKYRIHLQRAELQETTRKEIRSS